ncbi:MAG TPA: AAA family ATPase [Terriglobales bacterium]|nr:AAA family ATPase [Terriglobales bacterium]
MVTNTRVTSRLAIVGVCLEKKAYETVQQIATSMSGAAVVGNVDRYFAADRDVMRVLEGASSQVCIIDYDDNQAEAIHATERLRAESGGEVAVFAASRAADPERIIAAMRAGCSEYLVKPIAPERLIEALSHIQVKAKERARAKTRGKIITFLGAKGGAGVTSICMHVALHLAAGEKQKVLLVDQHPALGDTSLYLGTGRHQYSFYELASNTERLDQELLQGFLLHHDSGLDLLDSPEALDALHNAPPSAIEQTLVFLSELYQHVLVDCPPGLTDATLAAVAQSDQLVIVITPELPAIRNAVRYMDHLSSLGYPSQNIKVVLNRSAKKNALSDDQIEMALHQSIAVKIPNSYHEVVHAINAGTPIMPGDNSAFGMTIAEWASRLNGKKVHAASAAPRGGLRSVFNL